MNGNVLCHKTRRFAGDHHPHECLLGRDHYGDHWGMPLDSDEPIDPDGRYWANDKATGRDYGRPDSSEARESA